MTIAATGLPVASCLEAAEMLAADGIQAKVINIHTIKPLDEELIVEAAKETGRVVTVEEHSVIGRPWQRSMRLPVREGAYESA